MDDGADEAFTQGHGFVQFHIGGLRFEHPEFGEMAARLGFFCAERRTKSINLPQRHGQGFAVQLAALRQVGFLIVDVVDFE